jgi:signal transduction histidine kinase
LKFTPEGGRIDVSARAHDKVAKVSVTDTGVGIAPEDQEAIFEEFRQVGTANKKVEGTGVGAHFVSQVRRTPRGTDLGAESDRARLDVHVHAPGAS